MMLLIPSFTHSRIQPPGLTVKKERNFNRVASVEQVTRIVSKTLQDVPIGVSKKFRGYICSV
jgi:hypothetical protein